MPTSGGSSSAKHASWKGIPGQSGSSHWSSTLVGSLLALLCLALLAVLLWLIVIPFFTHRLATHLVAITPGEFDNWTVPPILFTDEDVQPLAQMDPLIFHDLKGLFDSRLIESLPARLQAVVTDRPDVLIVYAIAQGISREGTAYLLCTDFDPASLTRNATRLPPSAYPLRDLLALLNDLDVSAKLLILDEGNLVADPRLGMVVNEFPFLLAEAVAGQPDPRLWVLCSHSVGESSNTAANQRQSVFGRSVASALSGQAEADESGTRDGAVSLWELYRCVTDQCRQSTQGRQTPLLMRGGPSSVSLAEDARQLCLVKFRTSVAPTPTPPSTPTPAPTPAEPTPGPARDAARAPPSSGMEPPAAPAADTTATPVNAAAPEGAADQRPAGDDKERRDET